MSKFEPGVEVEVLANNSYDEMDPHGTPFAGVRGEVVDHHDRFVRVRLNLSPEHGEDVRKETVWYFFPEEIKAAGA